MTVEDWLVYVDQGQCAGKPYETDARSLTDLVREPRVRDLTPYDPLAHMTRAQRQAQYAEKWELAFAISDPTTSKFAEPGERWATDGSVMPASGRATAVVVGPRPAAIRVSPLQTVTSGEAERLALTGIMMYLTTANQQDNIVYTDFLSAVAPLNDALTGRTMERDFKPRIGVGDVEWMVKHAKECGENGVRAKVEHVKAHTDAEDPASQLNKKADQMATNAHTSPGAITMPPLTALMKPYSPWRRGKGFIPGEWKTTVILAAGEHRWRTTPAEHAAKLRDDEGVKVMMIPNLLYHASQAVLAPRIQAMTRTGQYPTARLDFLRHLRENQMCDYCGNGLQDLTHLFRDCPRFDDNRDQWRTAKVQTYARTHDDDSAGIFQAYLTDTLAHTAFWFGHIPPLPNGLTSYDAMAAHYFAVTLTAHIARIHLKDRQQDLDRRLAWQRHL